MKWLMMIIFVSLTMVAGSHTYGQDKQDTEFADKKQTYYNCLSQFHMIAYRDTVNCLSYKPIEEHENCFEEHIVAVNNLFNGCKTFLD